MNTGTSLTRTKGFVSGRSNCHLYGLNSYVIRDRISPESGMIRIFHNTVNCLPRLVKWGKFALAPHNHRQDISLSILKGSAYNVSFAWDPRAPEKKFFEWVFRSQIADGEIEACYRNTGDLRVTNIEPILDGICLRAADIHTVVAEPGSAWLVREGALAQPGAESLCYSRHADFELSLGDLYAEMTESDLAEAWTGLEPFLAGVCAS